MEAINTHRGIIAPLNRSNIDTDQIIAKQFLKSIARTGFGPQLFYDWKHNADGSLNKDFSLNNPRYAGASILVAGNNFGCGSSREHAVWAVAQYGFKVIIAPRVKSADGSMVPGFADIFKNNCGKNGILTIEVEADQQKQIIHAIENHKDSKALEASVNLQKNELVIHSSPELKYHFAYDEAVKERLLHGLDDIGITLKEEKSITAFEQKHSAQIYG